MTQNDESTTHDAPSVAQLRVIEFGDQVLTKEAHRMARVADRLDTFVKLRMGVSVASLRRLPRRNR